ncbi:MAG: AAA family ATPase [Planctomycetota bacterium]|nr:AAA family ATPase [Planctomycetota bacterium]
MKLTGLQVDRFGIWNDLRITQVPGNIAVFFGHNEAGKTTLMQFIREVLYGSSDQLRSHHHLITDNVLTGGTLQWEGARGPVFASRHWQSEGGTQGELRITGSSGEAIPESEFSTVLQTVDESTYNNVFAFGLRDLQELGTLDDTQAAELLYKLSSGLDRVSLVDVMRDLKQERDTLLTADHAHGQIVELLGRRNELRSEIQRLEQDGQLWIRLVQQHQKLREELNQREVQTADKQQHARFVELAIQVRDNWNARDHLRSQIARLKPSVELPEHALEELDRLNREIVEKQAHLQQARENGDRVRKEYSVQEINQPLWSNAARIDAFAEQIPWIESLQRTVHRLQDEIRGLEDKIRIQVGSLDPSVDGDQESPCETVSLSEARLAELPRLISALRSPSRDVRVATQRLRAAKTDVTRASEDVDAHTELLKTELAQRDRADLTASLQAASTRVSQLRRLIQLESKLKKMKEHHVELQDERTDLLDEQFLPWSKLVWTGSLFMAGMTMALIGIFYPQLMPFGVIGSLLGSLVCVVAVVFKIALERRARQELGDCENQLDLLHQQIEKATVEQKEVLETLPVTVKSLDNRLESAESELQTMEELVPLEANREAAQHRLEIALQRVQESARTVAEVRAHWRDTLRQYELPSHLTPRQIKRLSTGHQQLSDLRKTLEGRRELLQVRQDELLALGSRIEQLLAESRVSPESTQPKEQIHQLIKSVRHQEQSVQYRRDLRRQFQQTKRDFQRTTRTLENLQHRRDALFATAGLRDEREYRQQIARQQSWHELQQQNDQLTGKIEAAAGSQRELESLTRFFQSHTDSLEKILNDARIEVQRNETRLASLHERRGAMQQEMKSLAQESRLMEARLDLNCVQVELERSVSQWRSLSTAVEILSNLCRKYESDHQPDTLRLASEYLCKMTRQRYLRLWTPLDQNVLRVDQKDGPPLPLEALSRGTREAVFISLRLALVESFSKRGVELPLVLDDVLVNFDLLRAQATIEVLREFANAGHQLLVFTCHEHLVEAFRGAQVEIQTLPVRTEPVQPPEIAAAFNDPAPTTAQSNSEPVSSEIFPEILDATDLLPTTLPVEIPLALPTSTETQQTLPELPSSLSNLYDCEIAGPLQSNLTESELNEDTVTRKKTA